MPLYTPYRPSLSRWTRRTRLTPWCPWPPCLRSPLTSPLPMESLHQRMGPTPPPPLMDTPRPRPLWLTLKCESWHPPTTSLYYPSSTGTHNPELPLLPQRLSTHWDKLNMIHLPSSSPPGTVKTTMMKLITKMTIMTMPVMWKVWDNWPLLVSRGDYKRCVWHWDWSAGHWLRSVSCPLSSLFVIIG